MATAWVRLEACDALPGVCVKTGATTEIRLPVAAEYVPAAFGWLQVFGVWSFLFGRAASKRRRMIQLPISTLAFHRYRAWQVSSVVVVVVGVAAGLYGSVETKGAIELIGYVAAAVAFVLGARAQRRNWVGVTIDRKGREVTITRCHPDFARAAGRIWKPQ